MSGHAGHRREQCKHGFLVLQCRCAAPNKQIVIVQCPQHCLFKDPPQGPMQGAPCRS